MNDTSLLIWAVLFSFFIGATITFLIVSAEARNFTVAKKIFGGLAIIIAGGILLLPILFIPVLGIGGLGLSVIGIIVLAISYWKWWLLWIPIP